MQKPTSLCKACADFRISSKSTYCLLACSASTNVLVQQINRGIGISGREEKLEMQHSLSSGAAWMNGNIIPISEAAIPVTDWGLTHSDITYDVAPVRDGAFFRLNDYIDRFFASMDVLRLNPNMAKRQVKDALIDMVAASAMRESYVAMVCSRGVPTVAGSRDPRDYNNHFMRGVCPMCMSSSQRLSPPVRPPSSLRALPASPIAVSIQW